MTDFAPPAAPTLTAEQARALDILRRRPRLAEVLIAVHEMTENRRTCRVSVDIVDGRVRCFRESQERSVLLDSGGGLPSG